MNEFENYSVEQYKIDIDKYGLEKVWDNILLYNELNNVSEKSIIHITNFGKLYEIGLAYVSKENKKESGVYYTPSDVCSVLVDYFKELKGHKICDVCCGVGNLILAYLKDLGYNKAIETIRSGNIFLYDIDKISINICAKSIGLLYGMENIKYLNVFNCDFLDKNIHLPVDSKVISNPPYFKITEVSDDWEDTSVLKETKEYYSVFIEKIVKESVASVIITPFSFISGDKFYSLRKVLDNYSGFIFSFDNIPGNIFKGKKEGIFNSNSTNSVRAAITVVDNLGEKGFRLSPLIRFGTSERDILLNRVNLDKLLNVNKQRISEKSTKYYKCFNDLDNLFKTWKSVSDMTFSDLLSNEKTDYSLDMPKTCRYFTTATCKLLERSGKTVLYFKNLEYLEYAYVLLNSSFAYMYWRLYDGAITYADGLLRSMPVFFNELTDRDKQEIHKIVYEMVSSEDKYLVYKKNANVMQENIKFPIKYREKLNKILFRIIGTTIDIKALDKIHNNYLYFEKKNIK